MKRILIAHSFQKQLKKLKRYIKERDIVNDIKQFIQEGTKKGEAYLESYSVFTIEIKMVKLRICVYQVDFRYLLGVVDDQDYLPIIIDLKKGRYGTNLNIKNTDKATIKAVQTAIQSVMTEYLEHSEENPTLQVYKVKEEE